jgi:hypothetical protein
VDINAYNNHPDNLCKCQLFCCELFCCWGPPKAGKILARFSKKNDKKAMPFHTTYTAEVSEIPPNLEFLPFIDVLQYRVPKIVIFNQVPAWYRQIS